MWIEKRRLHAAMLDAGHPDAAAAVAFATGLAVVPYVIAQRRLVQLHERHYGIRPDSRFTDTQLLELAGHVQPYGHAAAAADGGDAAGRAPGHAQEDELPRWREAHGMLPLGEGEELCDAEWFDRIHPAPFSAPPPAETPAHAAEAPERSGGARLAPARSAAEAARLEEALVMTADRGAVVPTALRAAAFHARVAAVFDVREGMIHGVLAAGGPAGGRIDGLCVSASEPGMLGAAARGKVFHGRPPSDGIDGAAVRIVAGERPLEAAVLPIAIDGRVVQLLYVDNGPDPLPARSLAALGALCDGVATAYRRLVSEHTRRHC